jgi:DNA-directed RNA polymerase subunit K/omega
MAEQASSFMTVYEKTNMIGLRLSQIERGAKTVLNKQELLSCKSVKDVVMKEFETKKIPLCIRRVMPDDSVSIHRVDELIC